MNCPFCGEAELTRSGDVRLFRCHTFHRPDLDNRRTQSWQCQQVERDQMRARIRNLISERDTARMQAEQRWKLRRDIADELGGEDPEAALTKIREMKARIAELEARA